MKISIKVLVVILFFNCYHVNSAQKSPLITLLIGQFDSKAEANQDNFSWVSIGYPDLLQGKLNQSYPDKIRFVNRERVNMLIEEMKLSQSGMINSEQILEPGKFLKADFCLFGHIIYPVNNQVLITVTIVDIQTSEQSVVTSSGDLQRWAFSATDSLIRKIYDELIRLKQRAAVSIPMATTTIEQPSSITSDIQVISAKSMSATANFYQALNHIQQYDWQNASARLKRAIELDPDFAQAYVNLGVVYMNSGEPQLARDQLLKALQLFPESELAYYNLGLLYVQSNQYDQSINYFQQALKINHNNCETLTELGNAYIKANNFSMARQVFQHVLDIDSLYISAYYYLGTIARKENLMPLAVNYWLKVIDNNEPYFRPYKQDAFENLGRYWLEIEKNAANAIPYYEQARELSSKYSTVDRTTEITLGLAQSYLNNKEPQKAKSLLSELTQKQPKNVHCRYLYAVSLCNTSEYDQAIAQFETIVKMGEEGIYYAEAKNYLKKLRGY